MIPVEFFWGALFLMFGIIGAARGLNRELGTSTILLLSLFVLKFGWKRFEEAIVGVAKGRIPGATAFTIEAIFFTLIILFVAFISYEGVTLQFPVRQQKGVGKGIFGFLGGLLNGYLIVGTIWDVVNKANYFRPLVEVVSTNFTKFHQTVVNYLPITFVNEYILLLFGMILLLAIVLR